jgi:hypothetical protein
MKKSIQIALVIVCAGLVIIQFFQPDRNLGEVPTADDLILQTGAPDKIAAILATSCYDCHSNHTNYPWYSRISPVSWFLDDHIRSGKNALNFSHWGRLDKKEKIGVLANICDEIESEDMPLRSYLLIHRNAKLSEKDVDNLCLWTDSEALTLLRE